MLVGRLPVDGNVQYHVGLEGQDFLDLVGRLPADPRALGAHQAGSDGVHPDLRPELGCEDAREVVQCRLARAVQAHIRLQRLAAE